MRVIDADALKEEFLSKTHLTLFELLDLIDNAPTVSDRYSEGYSQGYIDGITGADWKGGAEE